jgi:hypothetical protein
MIFDNTGKLPGDRHVPQIGDDIIVTPNHGKRRRLQVTTIYPLGTVTLVTGRAKHLTKGHFNGRDHWFVHLDKWEYA